MSGGANGGIAPEINNALNQLGRAQYGQGGMWNTNPRGVASPQAGRPPLTGGLQQMDMLRAFQGGASMDQLQRMNPYTPRPTQFLPPRIAPYSWAKDPMNPANQKKPGGTGNGLIPGVDFGGPGGGPTDGGPGANGLDGGSTVGPGDATGDGPNGPGSGDGVGAAGGGGGGGNK
jgi:hypothetical protein